MKVSNLGASKRVSSSRRKTKTSGKGGAFAERLKEAVGAAEAGGAGEPTPVPTIDSVLALQEVSDATDERSRNTARRYGEKLLDQLEALRLDLLAGAVPKDQLATLARTMRAERRRTDDPRLSEIIDEIELRAEVEIAKLTRRD